jgi:hypothetical protein
MKKILFLTTLCCFSLLSYAQNQSTDNRWAAYGFSVAVEDEAEFVQHPTIPNREVVSSQILFKGTCDACFSLN